MSAQKRPSVSVPENINEEYYQISAEIMSSFPRYRPPVDLFFFNEEIAVLTPFSRKGARLSNEQVEEVAKLCEEGNLFVSRSDHHIYSEHIVKQLDLVLQDNNLKEAEIVNICIQALKNRYNDFYQQPVKSFYASLLNDVLVVTEYLFQDKTRVGAFMRRLSTDNDPASHAVNTMTVGLWLWLKYNQNVQRKTLDNLAMGLLCHDIGMSKVPPFLISRNGPLKPDEKDKVLQHPLQGAKIMQKMDAVANEILRPCLEHQERLDGGGYPQKLKGEQIHPEGKLAALADSFCAMIAERPYAPAKNPLDAATELSMDPRYDNNLARMLIGAYTMGKF
ncbi:MAG: HD domain-containing protein [Desulfovibrio sp.]|nr:HD domain-containing protein [Desulfovibrio sp.]